MKTKLLSALIVLAFILTHCQQKIIQSGSNTGTAAIDISNSPVLTAKEGLSKMKIEDGFEVKLVASEPLVSTPVAMTFDAKGRMWVVEMTGYMPDTTGKGEDIPNGKVIILDDKNKDGVADDRKVVIDSLVLPRAICLIENGILVAEPPRLWYYELNNDKAGKRVLVDDKYAEGGNVEHQPNGLLRAMDNWIYNAKSSKRYRKDGDKWLIETTHFRGQWGISQDNYGHLYYNDNSTNLVGDYFYPGVGATNSNQREVAGFNVNLTRNNRVYPLRPNPGVNRGYMPGILDSTSRLVNFTAACSPLVYRGDLFGKTYEWNAFVAEPSANLIKRNILSENGYITKGVQAYKDKEFLASTDERFRPVGLYNSPEGALYVIDMYRGIIQHKTYLTPYLQNQIGMRKLTQPLAEGRIYKIVPKNKKAKPVTLPGDWQSLVKLLDHPNGWVRDEAQQLLVDGKMTAAIPALQAALTETTKPLLVTHALWTLEGLHALKTEEVLALLKQQSWPLRMEGLSVLNSVIDGASYKQYIPELEELLASDSLAAPYIAFASNAIGKFDQPAADKLLLQVVKKYPANRYVADAAISNMKDKEEVFAKQIASFAPDTSLAINKQLNKIIAAKLSAKANADPAVLAKEFPKGSAIFNSVCAACHGPDGNGINGLAPPLNQSEWVNGDKAKFVTIVLYGLTGPVEVNGHLYKSPEINGEMPGIGSNKEFSEEDIAQLLSYIRRSWRNKADKVEVSDIQNVRKKIGGREKAFTMEELKAQ